LSSSRIKSDEIQMGDNYVLPIEQTRVTRQQAKVNTPNTAKLKQALKVAAVIYLHLSLS